MNQSVYNKIIKHCIGDMVAIGVQGDSQFQNLWETTALNYGLARRGGKSLIKITDYFFYFLTTPKRLEDSLTILHQNILAITGVLKGLGIASDGGWVLARQRARREIREMPSEVFYNGISSQ